MWIVTIGDNLMLKATNNFSVPSNEFYSRETRFYFLNVFKFYCAVQKKKYHFSLRLKYHMVH